MKKIITLSLVLSVGVGVGMQVGRIFDGSPRKAEAGGGNGNRFIAYQVPSGTVGNQDNHIGPLGLDFDVQVPIVVTRLGVFDSGQDGLARPIVALIYNRDTEKQVATLTFTPQSPGELVRGSRLKDLNPPLSLPAGFRGSMVAEGYGQGEPSGNGLDGTVIWSTNSGCGAIVFTGFGRYGGVPQAYPVNTDRGPENRYAAGTFEFEPEIKTVSKNGDTNGDGGRDISDGIYLLSWLFTGGPEPVPFDEPQRFHDNCDGTVTDSTTGLVWQQETAPGTYRWQDASDYCNNLQLGGHADWRLPEVWELWSIVDHGRKDPSIDPVFGALSNFYWSSTSFPGNPGNAWSPNFGPGSVDGNFVGNPINVRAVRSGP